MKAILIRFLLRYEVTGSSVHWWAALASCSRASGGAPAYVVVGPRGSASLYYNLSLSVKPKPSFLC